MRIIGFFLARLSVCCVFFFFSSRRRHTRYWRDWSSDVCSSDLDGSPVPEVDRQHPPAATRTDQVAYRVDHLPELDLPRAPSTPWLGHQRRHPLPFLVRQVRRVALGLAGDLAHAATTLLCPHPELESHHKTS